MPHEEPALAFHCCVIFIGFLCMTSSFVSLTMAALYISGERPTYNEDTGELENNEQQPHLIASAAIDLCGVASDVLLLLAVARQMAPLVLVWVVVAPLRGIGQVTIAGVVCSKYHTRSNMVYIDAAFTGIFMLCLLFFANVCCNYFRVMRAKERRLRREAAAWTELGDGSSFEIFEEPALWTPDTEAVRAGRASGQPSSAPAALQSRSAPLVFDVASMQNHHGT